MDLKFWSSVNGIERAKHIFATSFYVEPADNNYVLARFCYINSLREEFFWQAAQALEKYMKASLVLNGGSAKGIAHNLPKLFNELSEYLLDDHYSTLTRPDELKEEYWPSDLAGLDVHDFLYRLDRIGSPNIRYGQISHSGWSYDLFVFDQICFEFRRRTINLSLEIGEGLDVDVEGDLYKMTGEKYSEALKRFPDHPIREPAKYLDASNEGISTLADYAYSWNFADMKKARNLETAAPGSVSFKLGLVRNTFLDLFLGIVSSGKESD
ncbi:HEPN domain-containing protein [Aliiroseovarius sp. PTFE2010]|uniref:HEPN domain-containing protein n=1 Tax=Aliiroseovarius sp. PTFE2010 TaxID=3417190 RepID=UPI003CF52635